MIKSMTGYGRANYEDESLRINVEVKSVNAKYADVTVQAPKAFSAQESTWRNLTVAFLERGKIILSLNYEKKDSTLPRMHINSELFKHYYHMLQSLAEELGASQQVLFQLVMQFPEVTSKTEQSFEDEENLKIFEKIIQNALQQCDQNRQKEGEILASKLLDYLQNIEKGLEEVKKLDPGRSKAIKGKLQKNMDSASAAHAIDETRLAQEVLYCLERLDITEEEVRLAQHLSYFEEVMRSPRSEGKKMGFIAQEIGREINTIGSKANDAAIQKEVIQMKENLEKIKEQLQNIL